MSYPVPDVHNEFIAFGLDWKLSKHCKCWYAKPDKAFWRLWSKEKVSLKRHGFWVGKLNNGTYAVFYREDSHALIGNRQSVRPMVSSNTRRKYSTSWKKMF